MSATEPTPTAVPEPVPVDDPRVTELRQLIAVIDRLRAPDGCPWDFEQTEASMAPRVVEEAHELVDAVEDEDQGEETKEAGDILVATLLLLRIAQDGGRYDLGDAAKSATDKLIRRHPHVFGDVQKTDADGTIADSADGTKKKSLPIIPILAGLVALVVLGLLGKVVLAK